MVRIGKDQKGLEGEERMVKKRSLSGRCRKARLECCNAFSVAGRKNQKKGAPTGRPRLGAINGFMPRRMAMGNRAKQALRSVGPLIRGPGKQVDPVPA